VVPSPRLRHRVTITSSVSLQTLSESKQSKRSNLLANTTTSVAQLQGNTKSETTGQTPTSQKQKRNQRRLILVIYKGGRCERCKQSFPYVAFDFHHHDPTQKLFPLSQRHMDRRLEHLRDEADKCQLLCACCHRLVHFENDLRFLKCC